MSVVGGVGSNCVFPATSIIIANSQWRQPVPVGVTTKRRPSWGFRGASEVQSQLDGVVRNRTISEKVAAQLREAR